MSSPHSIEISLRIDELNPPLIERLRGMWFAAVVNDLTLSILEESCHGPLAIWPYTPADVAKERELVGFMGMRVPGGMRTAHAWLDWPKTEFSEVRVQELCHHGVIDHYGERCPLIARVCSAHDRAKESLKFAFEAQGTLEFLTPRWVRAIAEAGNATGLCGTMIIENEWLFHASEAVGARLMSITGSNDVKVRRVTLDRDAFRYAW